MASLPIPSSGLTKIERQAAKEIALARATGSVLAAREAAKIDALADVAETALLAGAEVASLEGLLLARNPNAAGLGYISAKAYIAMGNVVTRMGRRL